MNKKFMTEKIYEWYEITIYFLKGSQKFKDIQARLLFNLCEASVTSRKVENDRSSLVFTNYCIQNCLHMTLGDCSVDFKA